MMVSAPFCPLPAATVILSTYNQPRWLQLSLEGYARQTRTDIELIVADDGSDEATRAVVDAMRKAMPFPLLHTWQADEGFRKCRILNRAIELARAPYLIFSDGDCIPRQDFVEAHLQARKPGYFLSGGCFRLDRATSAAICPDDVRAGRFADHNWLTARAGLGKRSLKLGAKPAWARWLNRLTPVAATWNGHNASGWREDLLLANGFDERMGYGGEDRELGERLTNAGIRGRHVRYSAVAIHLDHDRSYVRMEMLVRNQAIREETRRRGSVRTCHGINPTSALFAELRTGTRSDSVDTGAATVSFGQAASKLP
jgi:glycosyltransferase involved in cell wall biosynthesis